MKTEEEKRKEKIVYCKWYNQLIQEVVAEQDGLQYLLRYKFEVQFTASVDPAMNKCLVTLAGESKGAVNDASHILPLCAIGYRDGQVVNVLT